MKILKFALTFLALQLIGVSAFAQQPAAGTQRPAPALLPKGKIAVVNTSVFLEEVAEFKEKVDSINRQFETRVRDVQGKADKINALEQTIKSQSGVLAPAKIAEMTENLDGMKRDYQRSAEDLQADASRARTKAFEPVNGKLLKFAEDYAAKRGIVVLIDLASAVQAGAVVWSDPRLDVTKEFVNEYNKANPVTTAAPRPGAKP